MADPMEPLYAAQARATLPEGLWAYLAGGAESERALQRNRTALDDIALVPRMLVDVSDVDTGCKLLGHPLQLPVLLAPVGSLHRLHADGIAGVAAAAQQAGIAYAVGCAADGAAQWQAAADGTPAFYQLYVNGDDDWLDQEVVAASARGYAGILLTVDAPVFPERQRDIAAVNHAANRQQAGTPVFRKTFTWAQLRGLIQRHPGVAFIPKGLQDPRDVSLAHDVGAAAVYLSNHGGRQYDQGPGMVQLIPEAARALRGQIPLIVDGGFTSGNDILKALALGADVVALGRAYLYPFACLGRAGVQAWLQHLHAAITTNLRLLGATHNAALAAHTVWAGSTPLSR